MKRLKLNLSGFFLTIILIGLIYNANGDSTNSGNTRDFCSCDSCTAQKFFILNNLLFFSENPDTFDTFNVFNVSSGQISSPINSAGYLPNTDFRFQQVGSASKTSKNKTSKVLQWMFAFDINADDCEPDLSSQKFSLYCTRMRSLRNVIVGRLTNQQLIFMGYRNGKLVPVSDQSMFVEFHSLFKHLDEFGYTSSVTYDQATNQFYTTHYGRLNEICVTKSMQSEENIFVLPSLSDIMGRDIFHTICYDTENQYTSVLDMNGAFFASRNDGKIDQITLESSQGSFIIVQSNNDRLFFNCYSTSPIIGKAPSSSFEFQLSEKAVNPKQPPHAMVDYDYAGNEPIPMSGESHSHKSGFMNWALTFFLLFLCMMIIIPMIMFTSLKDKFNDFNDKLRDYFNQPPGPETRLKSVKSEQKSEGKKLKQNSRITIRTMRKGPKTTSEDTLSMDLSDSDHQRQKPTIGQQRLIQHFTNQPRDLHERKFNIQMDSSFLGRSGIQSLLKGPSSMIQKSIGTTSRTLFEKKPGFLKSKKHSSKHSLQSSVYISIPEQIKSNVLIAGDNLNPKDSKDPVKIQSNLRKPSFWNPFPNEMLQQKPENCIINNLFPGPEPFF